jgi:transcriptional regulator with XRE-family HTH domain
MSRIREDYRRQWNADQSNRGGDYAFLNARQNALTNNDADRFDKRLKRLVSEWRKTVPVDERRRFVFYLTAAANEFQSKKLVAPIRVQHYLSLMQTFPSDWNALRSRLAQLVEKPGEKARLAREFGVSAPAISQWLSPAPRPTADTTLKLLAWVLEAEVQQQKRAGHAETRPAQATRKSKSKSHEKAKSDRKKK